SNKIIAAPVPHRSGTTILPSHMNGGASQMWEMKDGRISRKRRRTVAQEAGQGQGEGEGEETSQVGGRSGDARGSDWEDEASEWSAGDSSLSSVEPGSNSSQTRGQNGDSASASEGDSRDSSYGDESNSVDNNSNSGEEDDGARTGGADGGGEGDKATSRERDR
ncbi:unnamed protein product, partial [Discosporangium mesarthrocarpum]